MAPSDRSTFRQHAGNHVDVRRFRLIVVDCPESPPDGLRRGLAWESKSDTCSIGSAASNDLVLDDKAVSRCHCEVEIEERGARVRDMGSTNGTILDGVYVESAFLRDGSVLQLGRVALRFELLERSNRLPVSARTRFGEMVGSSVAMRSCFALMELAAGSDVTVLFEGETGTGKTAAAEAIHREGARRDRDFLVVDCSALAPNLIEDELFGHEKGAFTGAVSRRKGVFEAVDGGTVFLDEIGELPLDLQSKLLRVIENREVRRIGANRPTKVNVRIIAATHKDIRSEMNAGKFRADLYYRLAVLRARIPALRQRAEDIPMLVDRLLDRIGASARVRASLLTPETLASLQRAAWPGNIRELRSHLERCKLFEDPLPVEGSEASAPGPSVDASRPFDDERERALAAFERQYLDRLMTLHGGKITRAAAGAGLSRGYLHRLLKEHRIRSS